MPVRGYSLVYFAKTNYHSLFSVKNGEISNLIVANSRIVIDGKVSFLVFLLATSDYI